MADIKHGDYDATVEDEKYKKERLMLKIDVKTQNLIDDWSAETRHHIKNEVDFVQWYEGLITLYSKTK